nr:CoA transferase [Saccharopolyspora rhizosphaerae]
MGRRRGQGRVPGGRPGPRHRRRLRVGRRPDLRQRQPGQALAGARPQERRRPRGAARARAQRGRPAAQHPAPRGGAAGVDLGRAAGGQPGAGALRLPGLRQGRAARRPARLRRVIQAASGIADAQAAAGGEPEYWRSAASDKIMGLYGAAATCAALRAREVDGAGRSVEVPMFEGMASFMLLDRQGGWITDPPSGPTGYARTDSPHRRPYATQDGHLAVMM